MTKEMRSAHKAMRSGCRHAGVVRSRRPGDRVLELIEQPTSSKVPRPPPRKSTVPAQPRCPAGSRRWPVTVVGGQGKSKISARSTTFCSSRTLPGQS
jgi:hypothetical protein